jgi:hypothetical protein
VRLRLSHLRRGVAVVLVAIGMLLTVAWVVSFFRGFEFVYRTVDGYPRAQMNVAETRRWPEVSSRGRIWLLYARQDWSTPAKQNAVAAGGSVPAPVHQRFCTYGFRPADPVGTEGWDAPRGLAVLGINWLNRPPVTTNIGNLPDGTVVSSAVGLCIPHWLPIVLVGSIAWFLDARRWYHVWRTRRTSKGLCARCGYDLRATPERCPECGAVATGK